MANHRYWRVYSMVSTDGTYTQFAEMEFRATAAGADTTAPAGTALGTAAPQAGTPAAAFANDGSTTILQYAALTDVWCGYDYGAASGGWQDIVEVAMMGAIGNIARTPQEFRVEYSDDATTWVTAWTVSTPVGAYTASAFTVFTKPTAATNYRYWRARLANCQSNTFTFAEVTMAIALAGANQCTGGTAVGLGGTPANAFDAATGTTWTCTFGNHGYIGYDFGAGVTKKIIEIGMLSRQDATSFFNQWGRTVYVEASSDGIAWTAPIWTAPNCLQTYTDGPSVIRDPAAVTGGATHRWWGIRPTALQSGTALGVQEIEFRSTVGGARNTTGGRAGSLYPFDNIKFASKAYDGTTAEYSSTAASGLLDMLVYDYGAGNEKSTPAQVAMTARTNAGGSEFNQAPTAFDLIYSDDGINFTTQQSFTTAAWTTASQQLFAPAQSSGRRRQICNA